MGRRASYLDREGGHLGVEGTPADTEETGGEAPVATGGLERRDDLLPLGLGAMRPETRFRRSSARADGRGAARPSPRRAGQSRDYGRLVERGSVLEDHEALDEVLDLPDVP